MAVISIRHQAQFETTRRLVSQLVNERLAPAALEKTSPTERSYLCIQSPISYHGPASGRRLKISIKPETNITLRGGSVISWIRPQALQPNVILCEKGKETFDLSPRAVFLFILPWLENKTNSAALQRVQLELELAAMFQEQWLERNIGSKLGLESSTISWEQAITFGHPSHPMHRCCKALPPLLPVKPDELSTILTPSIAFISVPRTDMILKGPFESVLKPVLERLQVPSSTEANHIVTPCFARQLPLILESFPRAKLLKMVDDSADAEASIRSIRLRPHLKSPYLFKMSLSCQITAALRTITPWDVFQTTEATQILDKINPDFWMYREIAAVCGAQDNHEQASNLACILREDPEPRARQNDESIIIVGSLIERLPGNRKSRLEMLFKLESLEERRSWMRDYTKKLFNTVLPILCLYGISLEGHLQNFLVRVCNKTGSIKGFVYRDFGGILMHRSTLRDKGFDVNWMHPKGRILTDDLEFVWQQTHHTVIQCHIGNVLHAVDLEASGGWEIVREELRNFFSNFDCHEPKSKLYEYMTSHYMDVKCFLEMRIKDTRLEIMKKVPNILLA